MIVFHQFEYPSMVVPITFFGEEHRKTIETAYIASTSSSIRKSAIFAHLDTN
jgi:hypothetical protein